MAHPLPAELPGELPADLVEAREGTGALFPAALAEHARQPGALERAAAWGASGGAVERLVGLELAAVLAGPASPLPPADRTPARELVADLAARAAGEDADDADLRWAAAKALGSVGSSGPGSSAALQVLLRLAGDDDGDVRWQALGCLPLVASPDGSDDAAVVDALVTATRDAQEDVAEQALFVLAEQLEPTGPAASPAVADALAAHLDDDGPSASVAALGLARRGDDRAEPAVRTALATALEQVDSGADPDAVAELDDEWLTAAELLPSLAPLLGDARAHQG